MQRFDQTDAFLEGLTPTSSRLLHLQQELEKGILAHFRFIHQILEVLMKLFYLLVDGYNVGGAPPGKSLLHCICDRSMLGDQIINAPHLLFEYAEFCGLGAQEVFDLPQSLFLLNLAACLSYVLRRISRAALWAGLGEPRRESSLPKSQLKYLVMSPGAVTQGRVIGQ
jgi:hypothetical protein